MAPAIHIGPDEPEHLDATPSRTAAGGPSRSRSAEAVVWAAARRPTCPSCPTSVRWVQLPSAGVEPWIERVRDTPDVQFTSAAGAYATQVAEHALALLLAGVRGLDRYARARTWDAERRRARSRARRWRSSAPAASGAR